MKKEELLVGYKGLGQCIWSTPTGDVDIDANWLLHVPWPVLILGKVMRFFSFLRIVLCAAI